MQLSIIRGLVLGGSLGIFGYLFGITGTMPRSVLLGLVAGILAGISSYVLAEKKKKQEKK